MTELHLSGQQIADICEALDDPGVLEWHKQKLLVLRMHHEWAAHGFSIKCLRLSPTTLVAYLKEYLKGGLPEVLADRSYRPATALLPFWQCLQCLQCSFRAAPVANAKEGVARIEALGGVRPSESECRRVFKQMGLTLKKAAPLPAKADTQLQFEFFEHELQPAWHMPPQSALRGCRALRAGSFYGLGVVLRAALSSRPRRDASATACSARGQSWQGDHHGKEIISVRTAGNINA